MVQIKAGTKLGGRRLFMQMIGAHHSNLMSKAKETSHFYTIFTSNRNNEGAELYVWVCCTWLPLSYGRSWCKPGDLQKFLHEEYGKSALGSTASSLVNLC